MIQRGEKSYKQHTEVTLKNSRSALGVKKVPRTHLAKGFQISYRVPLKLTQPLINSALNQSGVGSPIEGEERFIIVKVHHVPATFPAANAHKCVFIILIMRTIQAKQTPIGLTTQRNG
jgi:hypothetical protein